MADLYGIKLGVGFDWKGAEKDLNNLIKKLQSNTKLDIIIDQKRFEQLTNEYNKLKNKIESQGINVNLGSSEIDKVTENFDKLSTKMKQVNGNFVPVKQTAQWSEGINKVVTLTENLNAKTGEVASRYKQVVDNTGKLQQAEERRIQKLGAFKGDINKQLFGDDNYIKQQIQNIYGADSSIVGYKRSLDASGNAQVKLRVATETSNNQIKEFGIIVDQNTQKIYQNNEAIKNNNSKMLGMAERMGNVVKQMVAFSLSVGLIYKGLATARESIQFVESLDSQMVQVRMITKMTKEQTDELTQSYAKMSGNLATTLTDISKLSVELSRQGLAIDETNKRIEVFSKFNKVIAGDMLQTTEFMTAGINSMGVDANRLADVLTKVGAVSGTSAQEVGAIIQKAGAMAESGKISLQELATLGAVVSEKTRESGSLNCRLI